MRNGTVFLTLAAWFCLALAFTAAGAQPAERQHLVFFRGTPQELDVYRIRGTMAGPTAMLLGGIHGDEPGAYLSADSYADLVPRQGNLIIVPRANVQAVQHGRRGPGGDMNRKFGEIAPDDPEGKVVAVLKSLMAESDLLLTLHDGSGFYRPEWISPQANPHRYGQCVIADAAHYTHPRTGKSFDLERMALAAIARVNSTIAVPLYNFHFFNMETANNESLHTEHRESATYFALTKLGIPAFCIETSKSLPSMAMKIEQHNLVVNALLESYGIFLEERDRYAPATGFSHLVIRVGSAWPLAVANGQTLHVPPGQAIEVLHAVTDAGRGVLVSVAGGDFASVLHTPLRVEHPFRIEVRKDGLVLGGVHIDPLPLAPQGKAPANDGLSFGVRGSAAFLPAGTDADPDMLEGSRILAELEREDAGTLTDTAGQGAVTAFMVAVNGRPVEIMAGEELAVPSDALLTIVDLKSDGGPLPKGVVMNLKGFIAGGNAQRNSGEDRGGVANLANDMLRNFSEGGRGEVYAINAEHGKTILASCAIRLTPPEIQTALAEAKPAQPTETNRAPTTRLAATADKSGPQGNVSGFLVEVDGNPATISPGEELSVLQGSLLTIVDLESDGGPLPEGTVMNLKGFVTQGAGGNTGEDRGSIVNLGKEMLRAYSEGGRSEVYAINAEHGKTILAACSLRIVQPVLDSVTVRFDGKTTILRSGSRTAIAPGTKVEVLEIALRGGHSPGRARYTLAGHPFSARLPQTLTMRDIAVNLAVFNGDVLAGKVTWTPKNK